MQDRDQLQALLLQIEAAMRAQSLWESTCPPASAFESQLPFFVDTMRFSQWLQWVFIARFQALLEGSHPLPAQCNVAAIAQEAFRGMESEVSEIIDLLQQFDALFDNVRH